MVAKYVSSGLLAALTTFSLTGTPACAQQQSQQQSKPNILFIMGDDIGWMQPSIYHRGLMVGETPNIDRIGNEGAIFMDYVAMQSCTSGRNAFFTGMYPLRTGMIPPQLPGSSSWLRTGTPAIAKFLLDLGYNTGEFGKNHLGDHAEALPTAHGIQEYWGYLYHLDAMQMVSFPDINKNPTTQAIVPPCRNTPVPGLPEVPGAVDPNATAWVPPPRPIISCKSSDGTQQNQMCSDEGPLTLERSKREFAAFGASNISSALSQGFAVTGADSRTAIGVAAGGRTQMTGLVAAMTIAAVLLFLTEPLRYVPVAALGAVLIFAAFSLFDVGTLREIWKYDRLEVGLSLITTLGVVAVGAINGILFAVALALARFVRQTARPRDEVLGKVESLPGFHSIERHGTAARTFPGLVLFRFNGPLTFFNADYFKQRALATADAAGKDMRWFVIDAIPISDIDVNGLYALRDLNMELEARGATLMLAGRRTELLIWLREIGVFRTELDKRLFPTLSQALK